MGLCLHQRVPKPKLKDVAMHKMIVATPDSANRTGIHRLVKSILALIVLAVVTGCQNPEALLDGPIKQPPTPGPATNSQVEEIQKNALVTQAIAQAAETNQAVILREGDVLKITFPGSPSLNTTQTIRKDGVISLPLVGEVKAAGISPTELDQKLMGLYASQLTSKEVSVEVQSASYPIYVTGAVLRPGKMMTDHSMTALEAVMEAGGFDYTKADMKHVVIIRKEADGTKNYILNLKAVMDGETGHPFYLKPDDIIFVRERFNWF
jgi:protein involved in polysaccharide export with SLBB domain